MKLDLKTRSEIRKQAVAHQHHQPGYEPIDSGLVLIMMDCLEDLEKAARFYADKKHIKKAGPGWGWNMKELGEKAHEVIKKWEL